VHGLRSAYDLPCNNHDVCYQTCVPVAGLSAAQIDEAWRLAFHRCNEEQRSEAQEVCRTAYPNAICPSSPSLACVAAGGCTKYLQERATCFANAGVVFKILEAYGFKRFSERQSDYCAG